MSDDRNEFEVSTDVELKLREASKRFVADGRQTIPAAKRLAQLRAAAVSGNTHDQRVAPWPKASLWPAAAVAALVLGMLGFVLGWTGRSSAPAVGENPPAIKRQVAEDDNGAREKKETAPVEPDGPEKAEKPDKAEKQESANGTEFSAREKLAKGAAVHVENISGNITISEIDGEDVVIKAVKRSPGLYGISGGSSMTFNSNGSVSSITIGGNTSVTINGRRIAPSGAGADAANDKDACKNVSIDVTRNATGDIQIKTVYKQSVAVSVEYSIGVPRYARIGRISNSNGDIAISGAQGDAQIETVSGSIRVKKTAGVVTAKSSNGDIQIAETPGSGKVETVSGNIVLENVNTIAGAHSSNGDIKITNATETGRVETVSGNIVLNGAGKIASAGSSNGDIRITNATGTGKLETVSGNIHLKDCGGAIVAQTCNGEITIAGGSTVEKLETVSGDISADISQLAGARTTIASSNGAITLRVAPDLNATVQVETHNGEARSSVRGISAKKSDYGQKLSGKLGDGSGKLKISTISGDITISPLP